jgi:hypothetical protein
MPKHIHLLISEPEKETVSIINIEFKILLPRKPRFSKLERGKFSTSRQPDGRR